jgi:hypothetical protein
MFCCCSQVSAREWSGGQVQAILTMDQALASWATLHNQGTLFLVPSAGAQQYFYYIGLNIPLSEKIWIAPHVGWVGNWFPKGEDGFILSLWGGCEASKLSIFLEKDWYRNGSLNDDYGYASLDYNPAKWINTGIQLETVNSANSTCWGPHLGFSTGQWHIEVQYYLLEENCHSIRIMNIITF